MLLMLRMIVCSGHPARDESFVYVPNVARTGALGRAFGLGLSVSNSLGKGSTREGAGNSNAWQGFAYETDPDEPGFR